MRLRRLTALERTDIIDQFSKLVSEINDYRDILARDERVTGIIRDELADMKRQFGDARRSEIGSAVEDIDDIDMIADDPMVITISRNGFIKREEIGAYRVQGRGGVGMIGQKNEDDDLTNDVFVATMHQFVLCFTNDGKAHWLRVYQIPRMSRTAKGRNLVNLLNLAENQRIVAVVPVRDFDKDSSVVLYSKSNYIKKMPMTSFARPRPSGIIAMRLEEGDEVLFAALANRDDDIILATRYGMAVRVGEEALRDIGRTARGVNGPRLDAGDDSDPDRVVSLLVGHPDSSLLTVCEKGVGKRTRVSEYRQVASVRSKGVTNVKITDKNGPVVCCLMVKDEDEIMLVSKNGMIIRSKAGEISELGRATQGVYLMRLRANDAVADVARIPSDFIDVSARITTSGARTDGRDLPPANADANADGDWDGEGE